MRQASPDYALLVTSYVTLNTHTVTAHCPTGGIDTLSRNRAGSAAPDTLR